MTSGIYKIYWEEGYFYYGQSQNVHLRMPQHFRSFKRGDHYNSFLQRLYNKYGMPIGEVVEFCDISLLDEKEQKYLNESFNNKFCCNLSPTASSVRGTKRSPETCWKIRQAKLGLKQSEAQKEKSRKVMLERYASGWHPPRYKGKKNGFYGKKHDLITRIILSEKKIGLMAGDKNPRARLVLNVNTGIFYTTIKEAAATIPHKKEMTIRNELSKKKSYCPFIYV